MDKDLLSRISMARENDDSLEKQKERESIVNMYSLC